MQAASELQKQLAELDAKINDMLSAQQKLVDCRQRLQRIILV